jgi:hypothetical protein
MQLHWHGREGKAGKDKGILTTHINPEVTGPAMVAVKDPKTGVESMTQKIEGGKPVFLPPAKTLKVLPGINGYTPEQLSEAEWKKVSAYPAIKAHLDDGNLEVIELPDLLKLKEPQAKAAVTECIDTALLAAWRRADNRSPIHEAIDKQLESMRAPSTKPSK